MGDDEDDMEGKEQREKERVERNEEKVNDADKNYWILSLIHYYSDFTHIDWDRVWNKNIVEFFNTVAFIKEFKRREEEAIKKLNKTTKS